jgi:hypothetical protein
VAMHQKKGTPKATDVRILPTRSDTCAARDQLFFPVRLRTEPRVEPQVEAHEDHCERSSTNRPRASLHELVVRFSLLPRVRLCFPPPPSPRLALPCLASPPSPTPPSARFLGGGVGFLTRSNASGKQENGI